MDPETETLLRREFPDFDLATLPRVPDGFTCTAWHNNSVPTWQEGTPADEPNSGDMMIGIDYADPTLRETQGADRFTLHLCWRDGSPEPILGTNDWAAIEAGVRLVRFIRHLDIGFHPDTRGRDYIETCNGARTFTDAEADAYDAAVTTVAGATDAYKFGLEVWSALGVITDKIR